MKAYVDGYNIKQWFNGHLIWRGMVNNGKLQGYITFGYSSGNIDKIRTGYYLNGDRISKENKSGCCYIWNRHESIIGKVLYKNVIVME
jgi:hypothetical protein